MHLESRIGSYHPRIMLVHKELDGLHGGILHLLSCLGINSLDFLQMVDPDILSPNIGKDISWELHSLKSNSMNEVACISSCAAIRSMVVSAWNCAIISRFYHRVEVLHLRILLLLRCLLLLLLLLWILLICW